MLTLLLLIAGSSAVQARLGVPGFRLFEVASQSSVLGLSVAFGDFDDDGFDDLVMGMPGLTINGDPFVGGLWVVPGAQDGSGDDDYTIFPEEFQADGDFGWSLAVGDFDGDGHDDLAVGVPGRVVNGHADAGEVVVLYGRDASVSLSNAEFYSQAPLAGAVEAGDRFGSTLAAGDLTGDGVDDLVVGVPDEILGVGGVPVNDAGAVNVLYGVAGTGLTTAGNQLVHHQTAGVDGTAGLDDRFGAALAIGEFTGDSFDDLAVGIPGMGDFLVGGEDGFGGVRVFHGAAGGLDLGQSEPVWFQGSPGVLGTHTDDDAFGSALAVGDFDGDGVTDLAIGAPGDDEGGAEGAGVVQILYGRDGIGLDDLGDQFFFEGLFDASVTVGDGFGAALAAGEFDGGAHDDLAIGAPGDDSLGSINGGEVTILYGSSAGLAVAGAQLANMLLFDTLEDFDNFGWSLAAGRFNSRSGGEDLAMGVPFRDPDGVDLAGAVVTIFSQTLFEDGFDSGDTSAWSMTVP